MIHVLLFIQVKKYTNINDIFLQCLELYGVPSSKSVKANKTNITYFEYVFGKKAYIIVQDPNDLRLFNWKIIKSLCENMILNLQIKLILHL